MRAFVFWEWCGLLFQIEVASLRANRVICVAATSWRVLQYLPALDVKNVVADHLVAGAIRELRGVYILLAPRSTGIAEAARDLCAVRVVADFDSRRSNRAVHGDRDEQRMGV